MPDNFRFRNEFSRNLQARIQIIDREKIFARWVDRISIKEGILRAEDVP